MQVPPIPLPTDDLARQQGYHYDPEIGKTIAAFFHTFLTHGKGKWAGKPFALLPWQHDLLSTLYGWVNKQGNRRFRTAYVEVPKKNGKSALVSGLCLFSAFEEPGAEVYLGAVNRKQASIIFDECVRMRTESPDLKKYFRLNKSVKTLYLDSTNAKIVPLSADIESADGFNSSFTCLDEVHRFKTPAIYELMRYAGTARENPLLVCITTAGKDRESICYRLHETSQHILTGQSDDITWLPVIHAASPDDDLDSTTTWMKANPSLGVTLSLEDFARELKQAKERPYEWNNFLRLRLNVWTQDEDRFFDINKWTACGTDPIDPEALKGKECWLGVDLARTTDTAAVVALFYQEGVYSCLPYCWIPKENAKQRIRQDHVPYDLWHKQGKIEYTEGDRIDYDAIFDKIVNLDKVYDVRKVLVDINYANELGNRLINEGIRVEHHGQSMLAMSPPTKRLEMLISKGKLRHGNHPVMNWQASNATVKPDQEDNVKVVKPRNHKKVDLIIALIMALDGALADNEQDAEVITL